MKLFSLLYERTRLHNIMDDKEWLFPSITNDEFQVKNSSVQLKSGSNLMGDEEYSDDEEMAQFENVLIGALAVEEISYRHFLT